MSATTPVIAHNANMKHVACRSGGGGSSTDGVDIAAQGLAALERCHETLLMPAAPAGLLGEPTRG